MKSIIQKGFTLIELILYIAIIAIFFTALTYFTWDIIYGRVRSYTHQEVNQNLRLVARRLNYEIRNASGINSVGTSSIELAMADFTRNPTIIDLAASRVRIGYGNSGPCPITTPCFLTSNLVNVSDLSFTNLSSGSISENILYSLTVESISDRKEFQKTQTYGGSVELRSN